MTTDLTAILTRAATSRFERYLVQIVCVYAVLWTLPTADSFVAGLAVTHGAPGTALVGLTLASVVVGAASMLKPSLADLLYRAAFVLYVAALAVWPFALSQPIPPSPMAWLVAMWPVEAVFLAAAHVRVRSAIVITLLTAIPVALVLFRIGGMTAGEVAIQTLYLLGEGIGTAVLLGAVRAAIQEAERAEQVAATQFVEARRDDVEETERARTDALVHDCVLTTLLSAGSAGTPAEEDLSRRMAANALRVLGHVNRSAEQGPAVLFTQALAELSSRFASTVARFEIRASGTDRLMLPARVADELLGAMVEVMQDSIDRGSPRSVRAKVLGPDGIRIMVRDGAPVGVQPSVLRRMRSIDGRAEVSGSSGGGTTVTLSWGSVVITGTAPQPEAELAVA